MVSEIGLPITLKNAERTFWWGKHVPQINLRRAVESDLLKQSSAVVPKEGMNLAHWFWNFNAHTNHCNFLLKSVADTLDLWWCLRGCICNKLPGDADTTE